MAEIVAGFASSHSPLMALTGPLWDQFAKQNDPRNRELVKPPHGRHLTFEQMLAEADPGIAGVATVERFEERVDAIQTALNELSATFAQVNPDGDSTGLLARYPRAVVANFDGDPRLTELDALIAYLQVLGTMVDFTTYRPDATAAAARPAKSASASQ